MLIHQDTQKINFPLKPLVFLALFSASSLAEVTLPEKDGCPQFSKKEDLAYFMKSLQSVKIIDTSSGTRMRFRFEDNVWYMPLSDYAAAKPGKHIIVEDIKFIRAEQEGLTTRCFYESQSSRKKSAKTDESKKKFITKEFRMSYKKSSKKK